MIAAGWGANAERGQCLGGGGIAGPGPAED